jgi:hypothetical protein
MESLTKNTTLNKDLSKIVYSYIDYSLENLQKRVPIIAPKVSIYLNCSIMDIIVKSIDLGRCGFYIPKEYIAIYNMLGSTIKKMDMIEVTKNNDNYCIRVKNLKPSHNMYCSISVLDVIEYKIEN